MSTPKAVLDTVVLISAFITEHKQGVSSELVRAAELGAFRLYLSDDILAETKRVLLEDRRHLRRRYRYSDQAAIGWCRAVAGVAHIVADPPTLEVVERDPNDNMIIACAVRAAAEFVVSRDKDLLSIQHYDQVQIVPPERFMAFLRDQTKS